MRFNKGMIKKVAVATFVVLTFIIYSIHQRSEGSQATTAVIDNSKKVTQTTTPVTSGSASTSSSQSTTSAQYKDGTYTGTSADAIYGFIQVQATISNGKLTNVQFLDYPQDRQNSVVINEYAMPRLKSQAIQAQSAQVDGVSGATDTSQAFVQSLSDALNQARA